MEKNLIARKILIQILQDIASKNTARAENVIAYIEAVEFCFTDIFYEDRRELLDALGMSLDSFERLVRFVIKESESYKIAFLYNKKKNLFALIYKGCRKGYYVHKTLMYLPI